MIAVLTSIQLSKTHQLSMILCYHLYWQNLKIKNNHKKHQIKKKFVNTEIFVLMKSHQIWICIIFNQMKSNKSIQKQYEEEVKFTELPYNHEQTLKLENSPLYIKYKTWLKENGVIIDPRIRYPSYFGSPPNGIVGISAMKPIQKGKAVVAVPYPLLITVDKVRENKDLNAIITNHLTAYGKKDDFALKILILYVVSQLIKGEKSFYYPYFSICTSSYMSGWGNLKAYKVEHRGVISGLKAMQQEIQHQFMNFLRIFRCNQKVFPQNINNNQYRQLFQRAYGFITTRAFGWSLPSISLIPLADSLNHGNCRFLNHFVTNIDLEKSNDCKQLKYRKKANLTILKDQFFNLNNQELAVLRKQPKSRQLRFIQKHKEILIQSEKLVGLQGQKAINTKNNSQIRKKQYHILYQQYKAGIHKLKNLHFYESSCTQDNDTDEDEVYDRVHQTQTFELDDLQRSIPQPKKKTQIKKFWKLYYDNQQSQDEDEMQEQSLPSIKNPSLKMDIEEKIFKNQDSSELQDEVSQDQDQLFEWVDNANHAKSFFIMNTKEIIRQNEQIYNFYGRRSNKFLLLGYNFIMKDNIYDSFGFKIKLDQKITSKVPASKLIQGNNKKEAYLYSRQIRLKRYRINKDLINICRSYVILWIKRQWKNCKICIPFERQVEQKTLQLYQEFINHFQKEYSTTLQQDETEQEELKNYEQRLAAGLRIEYKKILMGQKELVNKCSFFLKKWKVNQVQDFVESDMRWIKRTKPYLLALEQANSL